MFSRKVIFPFLGEALAQSILVLHPTTQIFRLTFTSKLFEFVLYCLKNVLICVMFLMPASTQELLSLQIFFLPFNPKSVPHWCKLLYLHIVPTEGETLLMQISNFPFSCDRNLIWLIRIDSDFYCPAFINLTWHVEPDRNITHKWNDNCMSGCQRNHKSKTKWSLKHSSILKYFILLCELEHFEPSTYE